MLKAGEVVTGDLAMVDHKVTGLPTAVTDTITETYRVPTEPFYMTSKRYVDAWDAALKTYMDDQVAVVRATHVFIAGDAIIGYLSMYDHNVTGLPAENYRIR